MPITELDPHIALVVIDLQKGVAGRPTVHPSKDIIERAARLAEAFREQKQPVVLVHVAGMAKGRTDTPPSAQRPPDWTEFVPEMSPQQGDHVVTKYQWGAFTGTSLDHFLRRSGVTQIALAGISTSIGVESTARNAYELGYHVVLVIDAMTDMSEETHRHSIEKIFPRLGQTTTTQELMASLKSHTA